MRLFHITLLASAMSITAVLILVPWESAWSIIGILVVLSLITMALGVSIPRLSFFLPIYCCGDRKTRRVALTFDDGPHPENTAEILDILKRYNVKAAFFCIGSHARKHPELMVRIVKEGHLIGSHTQRHAWWTNFLVGRKLCEELLNSMETIFNITGLTPHFFRPPMGLTNPHLPGALRSLGMECIGWDVRSFDTILKAAKARDRILKKIRPGSIVVLHDYGTDAESVLWLVEEVIIGIKNLDCEIVRLDRMLGLDAYQKQEGGPDSAEGKSGGFTHYCPKLTYRRRIANRLAQVPFVRRAIEDQANLKKLRFPPSFRTICGIAVISISMLMGLPAVLGFAVTALIYSNPLILIGGPISYIISWIIWGIGIWLVGPESIEQGTILLRFFTRRFVEILQK